MKTAAFTLAAFAGLAAAQSLGDIPNCASQCGQDMLSNQGTEEIADCEANDVGCLCQDEKFIMGLRDCATATCGDQEAQRAIQAGVALCRSAGVEITDGPGASATDGGASGSGSNTASPSPTGTGANGGGAGGLVSTITSDGSAIVTTLSSSSGDIGDSISSGVGSLTSGFNSITSAIGSATSDLGSMTSGMESPSATSEGGDSTSTEGGNGGNGGNGDATGTDGEATSTDGDDAAPMRTAAPAGIIAAAGLAALML